jgi:hypothetical protein
LVHKNVTPTISIQEKIVYLTMSGWKPEILYLYEDLEMINIKNKIKASRMPILNN